LESIFQFFSFAGNEIALFIISMLPLIELRGAIVLGAALNMPMSEVFIISILGNLLPVPILILFARQILIILKKIPVLKNWVYAYEEKVVRKAEQMKSLTFWGLVIFVGIPLPGTGAWTGSFLAAFLNMSFKKALPAIALGVFIAGVIMTAAAYGVFSILSFLL